MRDNLKVLEGKRAVRKKEETETKENKVMKRKSGAGWLSLKQKMTWAVTCIPMQIWLQADTLLAAESGTGSGSSTGVPAIDSALKIVKGLIIGIVSAIGVIILVKNLADFSQAFQQHDSQGMYEAVKGIAAGLIMALISPVLTLLGL